MNNLLGEALMHLCCWGAVLCGAALFAMKVVAPAWDEIRRFASKQGIAGALLVPLVLGIVLYGGSKSFLFSDGVKNRAGHTWVTNETVHIEWEKDASHGIDVPLSAPVFIDYRPCGSADEWGMLGQATVGDFRWEGTVANATNFDYHVWAYWVGPLHTNGVWTLRGVKVKHSKGAVLPVGAAVYGDGRKLAPLKNDGGDGQ